MSKFSIFYNAHLKSIRNLTIILVWLYNDNSIITLSNHLKSNIFWIIITFGIFTINLSGFILVILLVILLFPLNMTLHLIISFIYLWNAIFFSLLYLFYFFLMRKIAKTLSKSEKKIDYKDSLINHIFALKKAVQVSK